MNRALAIGVASTEYGDGIFGQLPGVNDDVANVFAFIKERGFDVSKRAAGDDLSANAVASVLAQFIDHTGSSDLGIIYLAGHGYRVRDSSGDETDGWDEAFVCRDRPILDDWWRDSLWPRLRAGARIVIIVDTCHAASGELGFRPGPPHPVELPPPALKDYYRLSLCACRDEEETLEYARNDEGGGVVTMEMLSTMRLKPQLDYRELWTEVATDVRDRYYAAGAGTPQLLYHGPDDSLLESTAFKPLPETPTPSA
jgi:hypothetical protein